MAGTTKTSKSSAKGKTTTKRKTKAEKQAELQYKKRLHSIVIFALGLMLLLIAVIPGEKAWHGLHNIMLGLFSWCAYLIGPLVIYTAILVDLDRTPAPTSYKVISTVVLIILLCGASQIFSKIVPSGNIINLFKTLYNDGKSLAGGGVFGVLIGIPCMLWFDFTGSAIIICLLIFITLMLLSGSTVVGFIKGFAKPVQKIEEAYVNASKQKYRPEPIMPKVDEKKAYRELPLKDEPIFNENIDDIPSEKIHKPKSRFIDACNVMRGKSVAVSKDVNSQLYDIESDTTFEEEPTKKKTKKEKIRKNDGSTQNIDVVQVDNAQASENQKDEIQNKEEMSIDFLISKAVSGEVQIPKEPTVNSDNGMLNFGKADEHSITVNKDAIKKAEESTEISDDDIKQQVKERVQKVFEYQFPPLDLLNDVKSLPKGDTTKELRANAERLVDTLKSFGVQTRIVDISRGPAVTRYELQPSIGVKISKITNLSDDIALNLAAGEVRIEAPIPNKAAIGIEVPNKIISTVQIREILESESFQNAKSKLSVALGKDITGEVSVADLSKMPHILIAGATGSGKSVCINSLIVSILYKAKPDEVKLLMIDPKVVELGSYNGIPHLISPVVTDPKKAAGALCTMVAEMLKRYKQFADNNVRDIKGYNKLCEENSEMQKMPQIVIIIDELADLMMASPKEVEDYICRLAQMARAAGMHLVIATQRPSVDVITGIIKANIPSRISFAVSSQIDSRTILDSSGAEKLLGRGDMLFAPVGSSKPTRIQGCFVTDKEVEDVVSFIKSTSEENYDNELMQQIEINAAQVGVKQNGKSKAKEEVSGEDDELIEEAIEAVLEANQASTSYIQRRLKVGYARAARIVDQMEARGIVGPSEGSKPRQILISKATYYGQNN